MTWSTLVLPTTYRPYVAPIAGLGEMLTAQTDGSALTRLVVMADDSVQAHVLARALVSLPERSASADVSLLTRNPKRIPNTTTWPQVVKDATSSYDTQLISEYLERIQTP